MMTKERIKELRDFYAPFSRVIKECLNTIEELKIKSEFDDAAFERVKSERDALQSRVQDFEKAIAKMSAMSRNMDSGDSLLEILTASEGNAERVIAAMKGGQ